MAAPLCRVCGEPMTFATAALILGGDRPKLGHDACAGTFSYVVDFERLAKEGLTVWANHIGGKPWATTDDLDALERAHRLAVKMRTPDLAPSPMRSVVASIPQRPPRTPNNPRDIRPAMRARVMERDGFRCRRCGCGPNDAPLVVDHIVPVAKGGTGAFDNLQTLCRPCNAGKSDAAPHPHDLSVRA